MSLNKVMLLGYVGSDPAMRYPEPGFAVAYLSLATTERSGGDNPVDITEWHNLVMMRRDAEIAERYIRKGTRLFVEGHLHTRKYEDRMKITRSRTEVIVEKFEILGRKSEQNS